MQAWQIDQLGAPRTALKLVEKVPPTPGPGELIIRVAASALALPDVMLCRGTYSMSPATPFTPGVEYVGEVVAGGAEGTGFAAIQLAKALGARVIATAGGPDKAALCRELGADLALDHTREDWVQASNAATGGRGVDIVFDPVGGASSRRASLIARTPPSWARSPAAGRGTTCWPCTRACCASTRKARSRR